MRTFEKILVPVDLSPRGRGAIQMALDLVDPQQGRVWLLHVIESIDDTDDGEIDAFYADLEARARAKLRDWVDELGTTGTRVETLVTYGHRAREIVRQSDDLGSDLIVLSSHRIDRDHPAGGIGTISHQVALVCDCPVLLIR